MAKSSGSSFTKIIIGVLVLGILAIVIGVVVALRSAPQGSLGEETVAPLDTSVTDSTTTMYTLEDEYDSWDDSIVYNGVTYYPNHNLTTMIFMGIEQSESDLTESQLLGNGGRADTIMLFILNDEDHTIDILEVNRDTWSPVDVFDNDRNYLYSGDMQLCLQYSFSDSPTRGCIITRDKVSDLLYGLNIDYYCSLTLEGMKNVVEAMGGLPVTFDEDLSFIEPEFTANTTLVLNPDQAERLFRYRDITEVGSNVGRMSRASYVMRQVFDSMIGTDSATLQTCYEAAGNGLTTDMDADTLYSIRTYQLDQIYTLPGEYEAGYHDEFHIDEEALQQMIVDIFYVEAE